MKILLVMDQFDEGNNGTTISARRFAEGLEKAGNEVLVIGAGSSSEKKYGVDSYPMGPIVSHFVKTQGMVFAKPDKDIIRKAVSSVDVIHFYTPFILSMATLKIAEEMGVPHTAAFHVQPENITYSIGLGTKKKVNDFIYEFYRDKFYNRFSHIHCPSNFIANQLKSHGYTANLHVISNGVDPDFKYVKNEKTEELKDKFIITMIGRYSNEKRQDVLIDAISKSKYADKIQLVLAGKGPKEKKYIKLGEHLPIPPIMNFYSKEELLKLLSYTDLYVHSADAEIEAISCIEAFACGIVPIISNSPNSATPQFALTENSLFAPGDSNSLAEKIDFWIEHPEERKAMEINYAKSAEQYRLDNSIKQIERMFEDAISDSKK